MRTAAAFAGLAACALLPACQTAGAPAPGATQAPASPPVTIESAIAEATRTEPAEPAAETEAEPGATPPPPQPLPQPLPEPQANPATRVPHVYMALQPGSEGRPVSAVFAIDAARDNTPSDDQAVRLTPENGLCNPHEMRRFDFPPEYAARPVVGEPQERQGLTAADLPAFMAVSVTDRMLADGLATDREQTRALNICTRKLWERLVLAQNQPAQNQPIQNQPGQNQPQQ